MTGSSQSTGAGRILLSNQMQNPAIGIFRQEASNSSGTTGVAITVATTTPTGDKKSGLPEP